MSKNHGRYFKQRNKQYRKQYSKQCKGIGAKLALVWLGSVLGMIAPATAAPKTPGKCNPRVADALVKARYPSCKSKGLLSYLHNNIITPFSFQCGKTLANVCREENCAKPKGEAEIARCQGRYVAVLSECQDELEGAAKMAVCKETAEWPVAAVYKDRPEALVAAKLPKAEPTAPKSEPLALTPGLEAAKPASPVVAVPAPLAPTAPTATTAVPAATDDIAKTPDLPGMRIDPVPTLARVTSATPASPPASKAPRPEPVEYREVLVFDPDTGETVAVRKPIRQVNRIRLLPRERAPAPPR